MSSKRSKNKARPSGQDSPTSAKQRAARVQAASATPEWEQRQAEAQSGSSPNLLLGALVVAAAFLAFYYHGMVLRQMQDLADGLAMPDHRFFGYGTAAVDQLRQAMDSDALGQLNWTHKTAGMLFPLFAAVATAVTVGMKGPKSAWRWLLYAMALAFAAANITQNFLVDRMLKAEGSELVAVSSTFTVLTWVLLAACTVTVVVLLVTAFVREFRRRWADPSLQQRSR
ncbi:MAG: hypothetical protein ACTII7_10485 [Galactobacter sp.]